jgi:nicotinate-nucleotide adenylyltransferase
MKIAILGGSFDPPHLGHLSVATQVKKYFNLDEVWLIPCFEHAFEKKLTPAYHRLAMIETMAGDGIRTSDWEIKQHTMSISINTLRQLSEQSKDTFSWIIGSDQLPAFPQWHEWQNIINDFGLIVFPRGETNESVADQIHNHLNYNVIPPTLFPLEKHQINVSTISSTKIRQRIKNGLSIKNLVTPKVAQYIINHELYKQ